MPPPYDGTMMPSTMVEEKSADASVMILLREDYIGEIIFQGAQLSHRSQSGGQTASVQ
jgi:hypothetical protein